MTLYRTAALSKIVRQVPKLFEVVQQMRQNGKCSLAIFVADKKINIISFEVSAAT